MKLVPGLVCAVLTAAASAQEWLWLDGCVPAGGNAAHDRHRGRTVLFAATGDVWELEGTSSLHRAADPALPQPGPRASTSLVYDEARRHVLLFGGRGALAPLGDTWTWNGQQWQQPFSLLSPPRRSLPALCYDSVRQRVVLHGGADAANAALQDTWEHDGSQWQLRQPVTVPAPLRGVRLCFDRSRSVAVLVGMAQTPAAMRVYEWNGVDWLLRPMVGNVPPPQTEYGFAFDEVRQRCVLAGDNTTGAVFEWNGTSWTLGGSPPQLARRGPACWFDPALGEVVVAGGVDATAARTDAWSWNGSRALQVRPDFKPADSYSREWVWSPGDGELVSIGGVVGQTSELWRWTAAGWVRSPPLPLTRSAMGLTADRAGGRVLLFGGLHLAQMSGELWSWDGLTWALLSATGPLPRTRPAFAFDEARGTAVLFGGLWTNGTNSAELADTWEWNGAWILRQPVSSPAPRTAAAMAYDPVRGRTVLFGGIGRSGTAASPLGDTWEWDANQWRQLAPTVTPLPTGDAAMTFDRVRGRVVLLESRAQQTPVPGTTQGLWDFDGANWTELDRRTGRSGARLAYDEQRGRLTAHDGKAVSEWTPTAAVAAAYGSGCGVSLRLCARTRPRLGAAAFGLEVAAAPGTAVVFALGTAQQSLQVAPGCNLLIGANLAIVLQLANAAGIASHPVPLPLAPSLRGFTVFAQAAALAPVTNVLSLTAGLRVTLGD